ncbi:MAG: cytochrome d ubiquinol oxidase subunit II [Planctomycetes bacterium]|nr:cytochrome d ubiquinol oxidase subunit II [Planctomycetota bacterium]
MEVLWFCLLWWMLATYVVLDGFDLGVGVLHLLVAKTDEERRQVLRTIGPVWDGNEVWLIAAGGTMLFTFPTLFAASFSGFYLPLMMMLWLLMGRALGIELRHQIDDPLWKQFWDVIFSLSSFLLVIILGAALGNIVRGVPLNEKHIFFEPLWTDFRVGPQTGILDWYTVLVAVTAATALTLHGALWLHARTDEAVQRRAGAVAGVLWPIVLMLSILAAIASFIVQPNIIQGLEMRPWGVAFPVLAIISIISIPILLKKSRSRLAFRASAIYLAAMVASAAVGIYPYALPARDPALSITVLDAAASAEGLSAALYWWVPGIILVCGYTYVVSYRSMPDRFRLRDAGQLTDHP